MTPPASILRRAAGVVLAFALSGCATLGGHQTPQAATREAIHARHNWCMERGDNEAHRHGVNAWAYNTCDREAERECLVAKLEPRCAQWEGGGP